MKKYLSLPKRFLIPIAVTLIIAVASTPAYYFYNQYQKSQQLLKNPTEAAKEEVRTLVAKVGALLELPQGEEPTVATVSDKEKLKDQPFFQKAENGDKVLIYTQSRKAILFRPSTNKIIEVSTVNLGGAVGVSTLATPGTGASAQAEVVTKVAIYNGTSTTGLTSKVEKQLKETMANIEVGLKENAKKKDYEKTIVVVLAQGREQEAKDLAEVLRAEISPLPEGETKPAGAEILVILGSDYNQK